MAKAQPTELPALVETLHNWGFEEVSRAYTNDPLYKKEGRIVRNIVIVWEESFIPPGWLMERIQQAVWFVPTIKHIFGDKTFITNNDESVTT